MSDPRDDPADPPTPTRLRRVGWLERLLGGFRAPAATVTSDGSPPDRIGRYRVLHTLGRGGMGIVYAAEDPTLGRRVALKTIAHPDDESRRRFRREARAAASVSHPHACQIFEIGEDAGQLFIAMELLEGEPLSERLKHGPLAVAEALRLAREMLSALGALHAQGVVHRDLKPSNVFVTPHGTKVLDFGLARPVTIGSGPSSLESDLTRSGLMVGTPRYMAPEQILGDPIDARTDVFAAGAVLFEVLAGRPAFPGATAVEVMHATLHEQPPALAGSPAVVAFDRVIRRALAKAPAERFPTAEAMSLELASVIVGDSSTSAATARPLTRLVVLPFRLLRADPEIDFLGPALADAVSGSLGGLGTLVVRSSAASSRFALEAPDLQAIAAQVDVDLVLLGTLLRSGDRLRVSTQLVQAPGGTLTWSHTAEAQTGDIFRLQDELADGIVAALSRTLGASARADRAGETPASAHAYEFYLRANEVARDIVELPVARDLYLRCVAEDPGFAPAWARLGRVERMIGKYLDIPAQAAHLTRAEDALRRALELSPGLPLVQKLYAHLESEIGRSQEAMVRLLRLARETRNDPELFAGLVHVCRYSGLYEASVAAHRETQRLDPHLATGVVHTLWQQADFEGVLEQSGNEGEASHAFALLALDRQPEAIAAWDRLTMTLNPRTPPVQDWLDGVRDFLLLSEVSPAAVFKNLDGAYDPEEIFFVGTQAARLGMPEATEILGRAVDAGYAARDALAGHPWMDPIRAQPAFADVLQRASEARSRALAAFREAGGEMLLGVDARG